MRRLPPLLFILFVLGCNSQDSKTVNICYPEGGYDYPSPSEIIDSNFYCYPIRGRLAKRDSLLMAYYGKIEFTAFHEANLSLRPNPKPIFRLDYSEGALSRMKPILISLFENEIIVKEGVVGFIEPDHDTMKLNKKERIDFQILESNYPLDDPNYRADRKKHLDSLIKKCPELADPRYYLHLMNKSAVLREPFQFKTTKITLSRTTYKYLVSLLNSSGFWNMSYNLNCDNLPMDAGGFVFEANTPKKYNMVKGSDCPGDTSLFRKACQEIVRYAKMDNKINLLWTE